MRARSETAPISNLCGLSSLWSLFHKCWAQTYNPQMTQGYTKTAQCTSIKGLMVTLWYGVLWLWYNTVYYGYSKVWSPGPPQKIKGLIWSLVDGPWGVLKDSWEVLVGAMVKTPYMQLGSSSIRTLRYPYITPPKKSSYKKKSLDPGSYHPILEGRHLICGTAPRAAKCILPLL